MVLDAEEEGRLRRRRWCSTPRAATPASRAMVCACAAMPRALHPDKVFSSASASARFRVPDRLTDPLEGTDGRSARRSGARGDADRYVYVDSIEPANPLLHELGTGAEIGAERGRATHLSGVGPSCTVVGYRRAAPQGCRMWVTSDAITASKAGAHATRCVRNLGRTVADVPA